MYWVRQKIPIAIQHGEAVTIEVQSLSGNGANAIYLQCPPDIWNALTRGKNAVEVKLNSSDKPNTEIGGIDPGRDATGLYGVPNAHYLFYIAGERNAKAKVGITFLNAAPGITHAEIIVCKTPIDTKPLGDL